MDGDCAWNAATDAQRYFGFAGAVPAPGDWVGNGQSRIGVYFQGTWYIDLDGSGVWDGVGTDATHLFGFPGAIPITDNRNLVD
jgi:hypothetical protein